MLIDAVEPRDIVGLRDAMLRRRKYKPATINGCLRLLRTMFRDAVFELNLPRDPTLRVRTLSEARHDDDPNCLTGKELAALLTVLQKAWPQCYTLFRVLAETGTRIGEASRFAGKTSTIGRKKCGCAGPAGAVRSARPRPTARAPCQSARSSYSCFADHRRQLLERQARGLAEGWVFPTSEGTLMMHSVLSKPLKAALKEAKIEKRFTVHCFRRTFNNLLRQATTGEVVRSMTGHVTERMTEHYSHIESSEKRAAVVRALAPFTKRSGTRSRPANAPSKNTPRRAPTRGARRASRAQVGTEVGTGVPTADDLLGTDRLSARELN
jgi:integrase